MKDFFGFSPITIPSGCPAFVDPAFTSEDDFWRTDAGWEKREQLRKEWEQGAIAHAAQIAAEAAERETERLEAAQAAQAAHAERKAEQDAESVKREERKRIELDAHFAALTAKRDAEARKRTIALEAIERRDPDFHAVGISLYFKFEGVTLDGDDFYSDCDPSDWELHEDGATNEDLKQRLKTETAAAMAPWLSHFASLGLIRADDIDGLMMGEQPEAAIPDLYLVYPTDAADLEPARLGEFNEVRIDSTTVPGATLVLSSGTRPVNATLLYGAGLLSELAVGPWGGEATPELAPLPDESREAWLARMCIPPVTLARLAKRWGRAGGDLQLFGMVGSSDERTTGHQPIEWLVPGLIPKGALGLVVAEHGTGKSTLLTELAAVLDSESTAPRMFLGTEVFARGVVVTVSGEDAESVISDRESYFEEEHGPACGFVIDARGKTLDYVFDLVERIPDIALLIVEPVTVFLEGRETDNSDLSNFYNRFNDFIVRKGCGVLLAHHVVKLKRKLTSIGDFDWATRGGGASVDRARIVIGMLDRGPVTTEVGIVKHNFPPSQELWAPLKEGKLFTKNPATLRLDPVASQSRAPVTGAIGDDADRVLAALRTRLAQGHILRRTGKAELWEAKVPDIASLSRGAIRNTVAALIATGRVSDGPEGLQIIAPLEVAPSAA